MDFNSILIIFYSYCLGMIPSAFLIVKLLSKKDIRDHGSGNVGAMNTYDVTGKKYAGFLVFILDFFKGFLAVYVTKTFLDVEFYGLSLAASFVVLGHNYNALLKFNGGRGLASSAGALSAISPLGVFIWLLMYVTSQNVIRKDVHISTVVASITGPAILWGAPDYAITSFSSIEIANPSEYKLLYTLLGALIILKNVKPLREALSKNEEES